MKVFLALQFGFLTTVVLAEPVPMGSYTLEVGEGGLKSIDKISGSVIEVPGTAEEIAKKGHGCIARHVQNSSNPAKKQGVAAALFGSKEQGPSEPAGPVIETSDLVSGLIIANNRVAFSSRVLNLYMQKAA